MDCTKNYNNEAIHSIASKAVGRYGHGMLAGRQIRAPDQARNPTHVKSKIGTSYLGITKPEYKRFETG